jgi:ribonuclease P protein component
MPERPPGRRRPPRRRLSRSAEFERVYRHGRSKANRFLVLYTFPREAGDERTDDGPRLGLSVSRRVGGAVERSRVKRVLREAFWAEAPRLPSDSDYVVVARNEAPGLVEREGMPGVQRALAELVDGLRGAAGDESDAADGNPADRHTAAPASDRHTQGEPPADGP